MVIRQYDVYLVGLDPSVGVEMQKTRPCLVVSPEKMHQLVGTVIVAPLTGAKTNLPMREHCRFQGKSGQVALDHLRAVDPSRLIKRLGEFDDATARSVANSLVLLFAAKP